MLRVLRERNTDLASLPVSPASLAGLLRLLEDGTISGRIAKMIFDEMVSSGDDAEAVVRRRELVQMSNPERMSAVVEPLETLDTGSLDQRVPTQRNRSTRTA